MVLLQYIMGLWPSQKDQRGLLKKVSLKLKIEGLVRGLTWWRAEGSSLSRGHDMGKGLEVGGRMVSVSHKKNASTFGTKRVKKGGVRDEIVSQIKKGLWSAINKFGVILKAELNLLIPWWQSFFLEPLLCFWSVSVFYPFLSFPFSFLISFPSHLLKISNQNQALFWIFT